jgi:hypothetical protein
MPRRQPFHPGEGNILKRVEGSVRGDRERAVHIGKVPPQMSLPDERETKNVPSPVYEDLLDRIARLFRALSGTPPVRGPDTNRPVMAAASHIPVVGVLTAQR